MPRLKDEETAVSNKLLDSLDGRRQSPVDQSPMVLTGAMGSNNKWTELPQFINTLCHI